MRQNNAQLVLTFEDPQPEPLALKTVDEIFQEADQALLEQLTEDKRIERKVAGVHDENLGLVYFSMWANTKPDGGIIAIGIEDNGVVSGCSKVSQSHINTLERCGNVYCPDARYEVKTIPVINSKGQSDFVVLVRVNYNSNKVVRNVRQEAYIRLEAV